MPVSEFHGQVAATALRAAGFRTERRDETASLADIFYGLGEGLAEWILTAPSSEQMLRKLTGKGRDVREADLIVLLIFLVI